MGIYICPMQVDEKHNPWQTLSEKEVYDNNWISVMHHEVLNPIGKPGIYGKVHFKNLAIGIIPLDEQNNTWIVGQFRYPIQQFSWEIPEGGGNLSVDPLESAKRELLEECGLEAADWQELLRMHLSNSVSDEVAIIYVARNLIQKSPQPDDTEVLHLRNIPFEELYQMVMEGKVTDSMSVAAVLKLKLILG